MTTQRMCVLSRLLILLSLSFPLPAAELPGAGDDAGNIVIYRDTWGIPHIYAPTEIAGFYAMGWAQAEDRPSELLKNLKRGLGELSNIEGEDAIESDQVAHLWELYEGSKRGADQIRPEVRNQMQAFVEGINDYYSEHPDDVPEWWDHGEVDEFMVMAFGRLFLQSWSFDDGFGDLKRAGIEPGFDRVDRGSNQFAIGPERSAEGVPILYIDPHLGWFGASRFWEFRVHAGEWVGSGFSLPGQPYIGLGHNENLAWAMTTGGPDTADVYELTLNSENQMQYMYDGEWREITKREVTLDVKGVGKQSLSILECHYGPVVAIRNEKGYAVKTSYADAVEGNEAWYELNFGKDYQGAVAALATLQVFPQNVMVADTSGNIYYQRTGRVPRRPEGFDWSRPVNGSTSDSEWLGFHPSSDHLQVLNPPQGYMQNCNIPPDAMILESPFKLGESVPYIWSDLGYGGSRDGWTNQRGARAVQLLQADDSVTIEEALAYAVDVHPYGCERWIEVLRMADEAHAATLREDSDYTASIEDLLSWNQELTRDSTGALKYYYWRRQLIEDHGNDVMAQAAARIDNYREPLGKSTPALDFSSDELLEAGRSFANAMRRIKQDFGSGDATYGDVFRVGRDDVSWPLGGGGDEMLGMRTLRSVGYERERPDHTRWGRNGQTSTQIVVLSKPIKSWTYVPIGQSDRPESPHYRDQAEKAFGPRKLQPTWWTPEELAGHVESRVVLNKAG